MKHECVSCELIYGEGECKPKWGYCSDCWGGALSEQRKNRNRMHAARPVFVPDAYDPELWAVRIIASVAVELDRRIAADEFRRWVDFNREAGWWCAWLTHWYRLGKALMVSST